MDVVKDTENEKFSYKMVTEACLCVILNLYVSFFFLTFLGSVYSQSKS